MRKGVLLLPVLLILCALAGASEAWAQGVAAPGRRAAGPLRQVATFEAPRVSAHPAHSSVEGERRDAPLAAVLPEAALRVRLLRPVRLAGPAEDSYHLAAPVGDRSFAGMPFAGVPPARAEGNDSDRTWWYVAGGAAAAGLVTLAAVLLSGGGGGEDGGAIPLPPDRP